LDALAAGLRTREERNMRDGWIWADEELLSSPMEFAWDDDADEGDWDEDLDWEDEEDDLDEDWDDEDDSFGRKRHGRPEWN
jgi:hypothetical protein